jgi:hypothetical protein
LDENEDRNEYIKAGVSIDIDFTFDSEIPFYTEIPVYANYNERNLLTSISVEVDLWVPRVEITDEQEPIVQKKDSGLLKTTTELNRNLIGSLTATGDAILICDMDMIHLCHDCATYNGESQIIAPPEGEDKGFHAGVVFEIESDREFPVYGEYEGDSLKRITIEIAKSN